MAATPMKYRSLTKNDLKRIRKHFRESHQYRMWNEHPLSGAVWGEVCSDLNEVEEIGFTGPRRAEAMARLEEALTRLYQERFAPAYSTAFSARYIYATLVDELEAYGVKDRRSVEEVAFDERYVDSITSTATKEWTATASETLERTLALVEKEPIDLTDEEVAFLKTVKLNPYGDASPADLRRADRELAAVDRLLESYSLLSSDVQLVLGGEQGLLSKKQDLIEGPRSFHGMRVNYIDRYRGRYTQARRLLAEELEARYELEESKRALAAASQEHREEA